MNGPILFPYQRKWVLNDSKYAIYTKARQIGVSLAEALWSVRRRIKNRIPQYFVSTKLSTAQEYLNYCKLWADSFNLICQETVINTNEATGVCLKFPSGATITACTSNGDGALRGRRGDVCLDEFAWAEQSEALYKAAQPCVTWGGTLHIISTPNGTESTFQNILTKAINKENDFVVFKTTLEDAIKDGLAIKVPGLHHRATIEETNRAFRDQLRRGCLTDDDFNEEFMCEPAQFRTLFSPDEYDKCIMKGIDVTDNIPSNVKGALYLGIDVGRTNNFSSILCLEKGTDVTQKEEYLRDVYRPVAFRTLYNTPFQTQFEVMSRYVADPRVERVFIDATGIGNQLSEQLRTEHGGKVTPVMFNSSNKSEMLERLKKYVSQNRIGLLPDPKIKAEFMAMRRVGSSNGHVRYEGSVGDSHCDTVISYALSLGAAHSNSGFWFTHNVIKKD